MDLWSKGLGKRVLSINLREYEGVERGEDEVVINGVLGPPVFWDYKVSMTEEDFVDFFKLITTGPGAVDFLIHSKKRWKVYFEVVFNVTMFMLLTIAGLPKAVFASNLLAPPKTRAEKEQEGEKNAGT